MSSSRPPSPAAPPEPPVPPIAIPRETSVTFALPSPGVHTPLPGLTRGAARTPRKPNQTPSSPTPGTPTAQLTALLESAGYSQYITRLASANLPASALAKLSNAELRDDLHVRPLRHRRELQRALRALHPSEAHAARSGVPEFGRILVHLSNVRTFHSWLRSGVQTVVFAGAIVRLTPGLRPASVTRPFGLALAGAGVGIATYGAARYWSVLRCADGGAVGFEPEKWGALGLGVVALAVAAGCVYVIVREGFWG